MDFLLGKVLDNRYEILERIGTGGMAIVYKAKDQRLNRLVAVKILKSDLAQDEEFRRRFNAESQAVAQLSHPNIVSVYDVSRGSEQEYIVMELMDGITLKQYMEKRGQLTWKESLHFITQIMRGLSHAHSRGIVHRDIKPQNVMVLRDGSVKVADFGIACMENSGQTMTQEAIGSVHYISPEQAKGDRIDARSDIYSAGVVMYEMLTGRLPFEGDSAVAVAIQHLSSIPLAPRELNADIPEQLELICMKAMASDINKRYVSANAMIEDLEEFSRNPEVDLEFELSDLRPEEVDEPTRPLRPVGGTVNPRPPRRTEREKEDDEDDKPVGPGTSVKVLGIIAGILALILAVVMLRTILGDLKPEPVEEFTVPALLGYTFEEAQQLDSVDGIFTLKKAGVMNSDDYPEGTIVRQDPDSGKSKKGDNTVISVWISAGEDTAEMMDVTNKTVSQAAVMMKQIIEKYSLQIISGEDLEAYSDTVEAGCIISSIPAAGEVLHKGDSVQLIVSKGPEIKNVSVMPYVDMNIDKVRAQLSTFGLVCNDADVEMVESDKPAGTIVWQSLEVGASVPEGTVIQFHVSKGPSLFTITVNFDLPQDDRSSVDVKVYVADEKEPQYHETVSCGDGVVRVNLTGNGVQQVKAYFDDVLDQDSVQYVQFSD